jgi:hypothetical protein
VALGHKSPPSSVEEKHPRPFANIFFLLCWGFAVWSEPFFWMLWALTVVTLTLPCLCPATCPIRYYPYRSLGFHTNSSAKLASNNPGPGAEMCKDAEMQRCFGKHATLPRCHAATLFIGTYFQDSTHAVWMECIRWKCPPQYVAIAVLQSSDNKTQEEFQNCEKSSKDSRFFRSVYIEKFWYEHVSNMPWTSRLRNQ